MSSLQRRPDGSGQGDNTSMEEALRQLTRAIRQAGAISLPTGTHLDYTTTDIPPAVDDAFRGPGRVLGRMYGSKTKSDSSSTRNKSDSSTAATHGSSPSSSPYNLRPRRSGSTISRAGSGSTTRGRDDVDDEDLGEGGIDDDDEYVDEGPTQTTHTAVVVSDNVGDDGMRRVDLQLPASPEMVTVVLLQKKERKTAKKATPSPRSTKSSRRKGKGKGQAAGERTAEATPEPTPEPVLPPEIHLPDEPPLPAPPPPSPPRQSSPSPPFAARRLTPIPEEVSSVSATTADTAAAGTAAAATAQRLFAAVRDVARDNAFAVNRGANEVDTESQMEIGVDSENLSGDENLFDGEDSYNNLNAMYETLSDDDGAGYDRLQDVVNRALAHRNERLEQALTYLRSENATSDPQWHTRVVRIEEFVDDLQGVGEDDEDYRYAGVDEGLAKGLAAAEAALAAEDSSFDETVDAQRARPPTILDANTQQLLDDVKRQLEAHRTFNGHRRHTDVSARANLLASADDIPPLSTNPGQSQIRSPSLATLLQTSGRSFVARLFIHAEAEQTVRRDEAQARIQGHVQNEAASNLENTPLAQLETHPYTVQMGRYRRFRQHWMQQARSVAEAANSNRRGWATLPPFEGAYSLGRVGDAADDNDDEAGTSLCRLPLPVPMEHDRRLLVLLRGLSRLMVRRLDVAPRPLLTEMHRYMEQGLRGDEQPDASLRLRERYDLESQSTTQAAGTAATRTVRRINETETRWLQFLLSDSTNEALSAPLPCGPHLDEDKSVDPDDAEAVEDKVLEEGSRALYHVFAHRFQALLDDPGRQLFRTADTQVPVTVLMRAINGVPSDPDARLEATEKTQFCLYDVLHFLARLSRAGRCRFVHHPFERTHGIVQRPELDVHPEHRVHPSWMSRASSMGVLGSTEDSADEAIGAPRRSIDIDTSWAETLASGRAAEGTPLSADVRTFFNALAFRFGLTLRALEVEERPRWKPYLSHKRDGRSDAMQASIRTWHNTYHTLLHQSGALLEAQAEGIPTSFADVIRMADPDKFVELEEADAGGLTETAARVIVRNHLIDEAASGQATPLAGWPATATTGRSPSLWDWAHPSIIGVAPQYFHMDRWPLHLQTPATAARVVDEARIALDPELLWDPASEDPASPEYLYLWSGPGYGYQRTRRVEPQYHLGDTALQRQVLVRDLTRRVADAVGIDLDAEREEENQGRGFLRWLGSKLPFGRKRKRSEAEAEDEDDDEVDDDGGRVEVIDFEKTELPAVKDYPKSIDWMSLVKGRLAAIEEEQENEEEEDEEGGEDGDDLMDVDGIAV